MQYSKVEAPEPARWRCGCYVIEPRRRLLLRDGTALDVEERTFDLIALLVAHHARAVDRREVIDALWGARPVSDNTLRQVVYKARQALGDDGRRQAVIRTLHGRSLRWVAPLQAEPSPGQPRPANTPAVRRLPSAIARPRANRPAHLFAIAAVLFAAAVGGLLLLPPPHPARRNAIAILPIVNATGDDALDWTQDGLALLLANRLESDMDARVVDPRDRQLGSRRADPWRPGVGNSARDAAGPGIVIDGRLRKLRDAAYELDLRVEAPQRQAEEIRIAGALPGTLAADAVPSLRRALERAGRSLPAAPSRAAANRPLAGR